MIARDAVKREKFADKLSVDDFIQKYEDITGVEFGVEDGEYKKRMKHCRGIMEHQGVCTTQVSIFQLLCNNLIDGVVTLSLDSSASIFLALNIIHIFFVSFSVFLFSLLLAILFIAFGYNHKCLCSTMVGLLMSIKCHFGCFYKI